VAYVAVLMLLTTLGCVSGKARVDGTVVNDTFAAEAFVQLKQMDITMGVAVDTVFQLTKVGLVSKEEYMRFDKLAVRANAAVRTARDAVLKYVEYRSQGLPANDFNVYVALALSAVEDVQDLRALYDERTVIQ